MASQKQTEGQLGFEDYKLHQVDVRLKLKEGPAYYSKTPLTTPETAALVMRDILKDLDREWVSVINMDNHLKPVNFNVVSIGSINSSIAPIQNVLKSTMLSNCNNILLMHNHPSGDVGPSEEDRLLTERLATAAKFMDINLVDHLIVGGQTGDIYSFYAEEPFTLQGRGLDIDYMKKMIRGEDARLAEGKPAYSAQKEEYDPAKAAEARKKEVREMLAEGHSLTPEEPAMLVREQASAAEPVQEYTTRGNPNPPILKNERRNDGPIMAVKMGCVRLPDLTVTVRTLAICEAAVRIHPEDAKFIPEDVARQMPENIQEMRTEQLSKNHPAVQSRVQAPGSRNAQVIEI